MRRLAACLLALALAGPAWAAEGWATFYVPRMDPAGSSAEPASVRLDTSDICIAEILAAQRRHAIPDNLLLAIGLQEAGRRHKGRTTVWPFAVNAAGEGRMFDSKADAKRWVRQRQGDGVRSIDVGCMQINLRWHPKAFASLDEGFDPRRNVDYAARFLSGLKDELGSWRSAAGAYHSRNPIYRSAYLNRLDGNIARANAQHDTFAERARALPRASAPVEQAPAASTRQPVSVVWGSALGGGTRGTLYSRGQIQPLFSRRQQ